MATVGMDFGQNLQKIGFEAGQKGAPEAKWALDEDKNSGKMIFMVRGLPLGLSFLCHLRCEYVPEVVFIRP